MDLPNLRGAFQGDDMGFKTATLIAADDLRKYSLPWHTKLVKAFHDREMIYLLHFCGQLGQIMDDLIDDIKIDARHSFEDEGNSILDFKNDYGHRVTSLGGIDVDKLARMSENDLRRHVRSIIDECLPGGRFALGSGNTVCNYIPIQNYFAMVEEGLNYR